MPRSILTAEPVLDILVIEDDRIFQKIIHTYLHKSTTYRTRVTLAERLEAGLGELAGGRFDVVLLDLTLPDSEGLETLERFQAAAPEVPVVVLTGMDDDMAAAEAVRQGAQDFLVKSDLSGPILIRSVRYAIERKKSEAALKASESRFRAVVEDQTELVCRYRPDGTLTFVNPAFCRYFGRSQGKLVGESFYTLTDIVAPGLADLEPERPTRSREQNLVRAAAPTAWIQWTDRALFDASSEVLELQSVGRDITEQKRLERQLFQSQKMETLGRLAGGVAHDFNNLLTVIIGCCEVLTMERRDQGAPPHPQVTEIEQAAERAAGLTRQLLAVSRRHVAQPTVLDLNRVIRQTEEMLRRLIGEQVEVAVELDPAVPAIRADRAQIEQILVNLVVNARDAMPAGGRLTLGTAAGDDGETAELVVSDTGVGMDREVREKIFEPFFTTKESGQGTGLGMSIVDSLVKQSQATITVQSAPRHGSTFRIRFPACDEEPTETAPRTSAATRPKGRSGSILLVEDEALVRNVVTSLLTPQGFEVRSAGSAEEALAELDRHDAFDVVFTDIVLPDKNGFELAEEVRRRFPSIRLLFMSGYTNSTSPQPWIEGGAHFLQKPFSAEELLAKLDEVLGPAAGTEPDGAA